MKRLNYLLGLALILLGFGWASAETVTNYTVDFNTAINTSSHDFRVASGWAHVVKSYYDSDEWEEIYVSYSHSATGGVEGTGALKIGTQVLDYYGSSWVNDMLVTPAVTGTVTLKVKAVSSAGTSGTGIKIWKVTKDGDAYTLGDIAVNETGANGIIQNTNDWYTVTVENLNNEMLGIVGSRVLIDDFAVAGSAEIELEKALKMNSVTLEGSTSRDCDAEGNFSFTYTVKFTNVGEVALDNTMDNYTLTLGGVKYESGSGYVIDEEKILTTVPIEAASIAIGEQVTQVIEVNANISSPAFGGNGARSRIDVRENISGTSAAGSWIEPIKYEAILTVRNSNGNNLIEYPSYAAAFGTFGMVNENVSKTLELRNSGAAPAEVTITMPEGFTAEPSTTTVPAHGSVNVTVTIDASTSGIKSGNMVIASNGLTEDFVMPLSGTVLDNTKFFEDFEANNNSANVPAGWYAPTGNWEKTTKTSNSNNYVSANLLAPHKLITPLLRVAEGEKMSFDAFKKSDNSDPFVKVYYSADRKEWTLVKEIPAADLTFNSYSPYNDPTFTTFVVEGVPAGEYYIAFESGYCAIDNVYGFELVPVTHDVVVDKYEIPGSVMANNDVKAKVTLRNLLDVAETEYTSNLYFDGAKVAAADAIEIPANGTATVEFTFVANEVGTFPAKAEFVWADEYTVATDEVEVEVTEEQGNNVIVVGNTDPSNTAAWTTDNAFNVVPINTYYNHSVSEALYTPAMLEEAGLVQGDVITNIAYMGYAPDAVSSDIKVYVVSTEDTEIVTPFTRTDLANLTPVYEGNYTLTGGSESGLIDLFTFELAQPLTWDGKSMRIIVTSDLTTTYKKTYFLSDKSIVGDIYGYRSDNVTSADMASSSLSKQSSFPVTKFTIVAEPIVYSGVVTDNDGNALEGVTVTLTSQVPETVEGAPRHAATAGPAVYTATTDAEGKFTVEVVQTDKIYNANFAKEGYKDVNLEGVDFANGNVVLQEPVVMEPDALTGVESMNAGKAVAGVKYYNVAGQASDKAFKGVNIVVTTYTDGTTRTVKVVK